MDYKTTITEIGELVSDFMEQGMLIVFNENVPAELAEISVLHTAAVLEKDVQVKDVVILGNNKYTITAVGNDANRTLKTMGHCTLCFNRADTTTLPGQIELTGSSLPEISVNESFEIIFNPIQSK